MHLFVVRNLMGGSPISKKTVNKIYRNFSAYLGADVNFSAIFQISAIRKKVSLL